MAYITYQEYVDLFGTPAITEAEFPIYATTASDLIDTLTEFRIVNAGGVSAFPAAVQTLIEKAAAAQVLYLIQNGLEAVLTGQTGAGYTVGKVHIDGGNTKNLTQILAQKIQML